MPISSSSLSPIVIYIHWPFCAKKCSYCAFNSYVMTQCSSDHSGVTSVHWQKKWADAYCIAIKHYAQITGYRNVAAIHFGGGTPSLMAADTIDGILSYIFQNFNVEKDVEIALEMNPSSHTYKDINNNDISQRDWLYAIRSVGINRLSIGVQSFCDDSLLFLGRQHTSIEAIDTIKNVSDLFDNFSIDLMYGLPHQQISAWINELKYAMMIGFKHMSLYQLTIYDDTKLGKMVARGDVAMPNQERVADFYVATQNFVSKHKKYRQYEVSNYAIPGYESKYNTHCWKYGEYIGVGPGAHGRITNMYHCGKKLSRIATVEHHNPEVWLKSIMMHAHGCMESIALSESDSEIERIMMGLRLCDGVICTIDHDGDDDNDSAPLIFNEDALHMLARKKLLNIGTKCKGQCVIACTNNGLLLLDSIMAEIII